MNMWCTQNKKPGVAAPGFLFVLAVSFNYLSSYLQI